MVQCPLLKGIWNIVNQNIVQLLGKPLTLKVENKLFGISHSTSEILSMKQINEINNILLIAKFAIIKARAQNSNNFILYYEEESQIRHHE